MRDKKYVRVIFFMVGLVVLCTSFVHVMAIPPDRGKALTTAWGESSVEDLDITTKGGIQDYFVGDRARLIDIQGVNQSSKRDEVKGWTLLHLACYDGNNTLIEILLQTRGTNFAPINRAGQIPLELYGGLGVTHRLEHLDTLIENTLKSKNIADPKVLGSYYRAKKLMIDHNSIDKAKFEKFETPLFKLSASLGFLKVRLFQLASRLKKLQKDN